MRKPMPISVSPTVSSPIWKRNQNRSPMIERNNPMTINRFILLPRKKLEIEPEVVIKAPGIIRRTETKRPYFKAPTKGLYLAGASTFPGGGIEGSTISGIICANDICKWEVRAL